MNKSTLMQLLLALVFIVPICAHSAPLNLSNVPLYLGGSVDSNVIFMIDDSGSMHFELMPDQLRTQSGNNSTNDSLGPTYMFPRGNTGLYGGGDNSTNNVPSFRFKASETSNINERITAAYYRSHTHNTAYYNPAVKYIPWPNDDNTGPYVSWGGTSGNSNPESAYHHPIRTSKGAINLTTVNTSTASWTVCTSPIPGANGCSSQTVVSRSFYPAVYYHFTGGEIWNVNNYQQVEIRSTTPTYSGHGRENRSDCVNGVCTYAQEIQNFANWYTYYRSRLLASQGSIGRAFSSQRENMRVGFGTLNAGSTNIDGVNTSRIVRGVRPFSGTNRTAFFNQLYERTYPFSGTTLREALDAAGQYYSRTDSKGPWGENPGTGSETSSEHLSCRQSFTVLMTDGYWSDTSFSSANNQDGSNGLVIKRPDSAAGEDFQYKPLAPFSDNYSNTLADVAMKYWKNDLRTDLDNRVPTTIQNPAFWQHMVTFGVSLGLAGTIMPETAFAAISSNSTIAWPEPVGFTSSKIDDLLHASVNSRGGFFSAEDPDTFANDLSSVLSAIQDREESSASSVALNSGSISSTSRVFQARFDSRDWSGQLLSFAINTTPGENLGNLIMPAEWDARNLIPTANNRKIITYDGSSGKPFRYLDINQAQRDSLKNEATLNYLRGDKSNEMSNNGEFRNRKFLLGDIINSNPALVAAPVQRYPDNWGPGAPENVNPYSTFREDNKSRLPVVYVGANDGMLHAFNANTGAEIFGYVPGALFERLSLLTTPEYTHRYYVDGSPTIVDAFDSNGNIWKSVLVSGLGSGGQGIFALDVTNPDVSTADESTLANKVLWEYTDKTDADSADMGYTFGQPSIVRLQNGQWAALFSGGYNNISDNSGDGTANDSTTGNAVLYLIDLFDGTFIAKFDTKNGTAEDPTENGRPNGFASPAAIDVDGDSIVDFIYAGDLFGNMWKIDVSHPEKEKWGFAFGTQADPEPFFKACFGNDCEGVDKNKVQPITTRPQIVRHPTSKGFLVMFGTGKYFEIGDNSATGQITQSFYAIWDKAENTLTPIVRSNLLQQKIDSEVRVSGSDYRVTSNKIIDWANQKGWFIDLISPGATSNLGERQVSNAIIRNGKVIFTTLLPSDDPCLYGGSSWLMELDFISGSRLDYSPFDINDDGSFDSTDYICIANCELDADGNPDPNRVLVPASGKKSDVGIIPTPSIASETGGQREFKYTSGSSGNIEVTLENPGPGFEGRQSWRQLDFQFR